MRTAAGVAPRRPALCDALRVFVLHPRLLMPAARAAAPVGWLAFVGLALLASSAIVRRERPAPALPADFDDLLARIYR